MGLERLKLQKIRQNCWVAPKNKDVLFFKKLSDMIFFAKIKFSILYFTNLILKIILFIIFENNWMSKSPLNSKIFSKFYGKYFLKIFWKKSTFDLF